MRGLPPSTFQVAPHSIMWTRVPAMPSDLTVIGRLIYGREGYRLSGWRLAVAALPFLILSLMAILLLAISALCLYGALAAGRDAVVAATTTALFFTSAALFCIWREVLPALPIRKVENRAAGLPVAWQARNVWIDAVAGRRADRAARRQAVLWKADCGVCGGPLELVEIDSRRKLPPVGRCRNRPREHCYAFDRATLVGEWVSQGDRPDDDPCPDEVRVGCIHR